MVCGGLRCEYNKHEAMRLCRYTTFPCASAQRSSCRKSDQHSKSGPLLRFCSNSLDERRGDLELKVDLGSRVRDSAQYLMHPT